MNISLIFNLYSSYHHFYRFVIVGAMQNYGYSTKFMAASIDYHNDFSTTTSVMGILSIGTNDGVSETNFAISTTICLK